MSNVCDRLYETAGVRPSRHWLNAYRASHRGEDSADTILQQILHEDLRDVVREMQVTITDRINVHSQNLRQVIRSLQPGQTDMRNSPMKATLPVTFRLMIQVEEIVDVAQNQETRLSGRGGVQQRCLKLCISDGFYGNGSSIPPNRTNDGEGAEPQTIFAMEVSPIPNLAVDAKAGIKLVLHGPIDVRWGYLLLHEGNALVLGGYVHRLAEIQAKAIEHAKRETGVGIDPTLKALVWNPLTGDEQDQDEGEQGSGDVVAEEPAPPMRPQAPTMPIFNPAAVPNRRGSEQAIGTTTRQTAIRQPLAATPAPTHYNIARPGQRSPPTTLPSRQPPEPAPIFPNTKAPMGRTQSINPYARNTTISNSDYASSTVVRQPHCSTTAQTSNSFRTPSNSQYTGLDTFPQEINPPVPDVTMEDSTQARNQPDPRLESASSSSNSTLLKSSGSKDDHKLEVSFDHLREILTQARNDENIYKQYLEKVFVVRMKQCESHHYFNIEKVKKQDRKQSASKKDKKYAYSIHAKFDGESGGDRITCAIDGEVLEPYFGFSPAEMRNMSRADKARSTDLVNEGGQKAKEACYELATWDATLYHPLDDFFRSPSTPSPALDGKIPILLVGNRRNS